MVIVGFIPALATASSPPLCEEQQGTVLSCYGNHSGNSADFAGNCAYVPNMVLVECPLIYEEVRYTRHQAMEHCNRNAYDPDSWRYWGSACNFDGETAYRTCLAAGYDGAKDISIGSWYKAFDNGITRWEPDQGRFVSYNAIEAGNRLIDSMTCWRNRYASQ